jgi:hypothetical protein
MDDDELNRVVELSNAFMDLAAGYDRATVLSAATNVMVNQFIASGGMPDTTARQLAKGLRDAAAYHRERLRLTAN